MTADLTAAECGGQGSPAAAAPHLLQAAGVSGQGEGGGVEVEPVLPDVEGGHLAGLALHPAAHKLFTKTKQDKNLVLVL